jgi:hypothetical protein
MILSILNVLGCIIVFPLLILVLGLTYWMIGCLIFEILCGFKYIDGTAALINRAFDAYEKRRLRKNNKEPGVGRLV